MSIRETRSMAQHGHLYSKTRSKHKHIWKALNINDQTVPRRISSMFPMHSALSPASLHPTQKTVLPRKRGLFPGGHFQGASTSISVLEADRLGWLENVSLALFHFLWRPHTHFWCPSFLPPSVVGWGWFKAGPYQSHLNFNDRAWDGWAHLQWRKSYHLIQGQPEYDSQFCCMLSMWLWAKYFTLPSLCLFWPLISKNNCISNIH